MHVAVIGAGAFGGWTALFLNRLGHRVTLVDTWGPGNSRASSGGETRIIRSIYGDDLTSVRMAARSLALWKEHQERWHSELYLRTGALFLAPKDDDYIAASIAALAAEGIAVEILLASEASRCYPQFNLKAGESLEAVDSVLIEPEAGVLFARRNCRTVVDHFVKEGGAYRLAEARPGPVANGRLNVELNTGAALQADAYVFACGPWLGRLFPEIVGSLILTTRQDVLFFGTPPGSSEFGASELPCWVDRTSKQKFYGIPDVENRGFKVASDERGGAFDPDSDDRAISRVGLSETQAYLRHRFPALARAPLIEGRVCQYENSPDVAFVIDRHPAAPNVWLVGGGSGHGYKHGPAVGEHVAAIVTGTQAPSTEFCLARFTDGSALRRSSTI
jgi:glycine/D-amino acid oxidase-like deaminating enzyme